MKTKSNIYYEQIGLTHWSEELDKKYHQVHKKTRKTPYRAS